MATTNGNGRGSRTAKLPLAKYQDLTPGQKRILLGEEVGTQFDAYSRMFATFGGGQVFETGEWRARDMDLMLRRDGTAAMVEQALVLPIASNSFHMQGLKGDTGELELCQEQLLSPPEAGGFAPGWETVKRQLAESAVYTKEFFETEWDFVDGKVVLKNIQWRPPETCEVKRDEHTAVMDGFRQRAWWYFTGAHPKTKDKNFSGYLDIPKMRSLVHIHGVQRNPLSGTSDMEVAYWAYKQKQKLLYLWFQFLENQSLPKLAVYGSDQDQADDYAESIAEMKASAVAGFQRPPPGSSLFDVIESSGQGAQQFLSALDFLSSYQTNSTLSSFLSLPSAAVLGRGSYALSESATQFFQWSRQQACWEICESWTNQIITKLCVLNFGPDAKIPRLTAQPLDKSSTAALISTLTTLAAAPALRVPDEYVLMLAEQAADVFNLPQDKVHDVLDRAAKLAQANAAAGPNPAGATPQGQGAAKIAAATAATQRLIRSQQPRGGGRDALQGGGYGAASVSGPA